MKVGFSWTVLGRTSLRFKIQTLRSGPTVDAGVSSARVRQTRTGLRGQEVMSELGDGEVKPQTAFRKPIQLFFQPSSYFPLSPSLTQTVKLKRLLQAKRHSLPDSCSERPSIRRLGRRRQNNGLLWQVFVAVLPPVNQTL